MILMDEINTYRLELFFLQYPSMTGIFTIVTRVASTIFCRFSMTLRMGQVHVLLLRNQVLINTNMMRWSSNPIKLYGR